MKTCAHTRRRGGRGYGAMAAVAGMLFFALSLQAQSGFTIALDVTTLAGSARQSGSADGTGSAARFFWPQSVAVDTSGTVYVADTGNHAIRKITPGGVVTTLAGSPGPGGNADGTGSTARFYLPMGVAVDASGTVYVADEYNNNIRKITPGGVVTTLAGSAPKTGSADGLGSAARFYQPSGVAVDATGTVYVADTGNYTIRKITPGGVVTTLAGSPGQGGHADGTGPAARFYWPQGVAVDASGTVYVADTQNDTIRKITPGGVVTTLAGLAGTYGSSVDGIGSAARLDGPYGVAVDASGTVYVAEGNGQTIREITPGGVVTTLAGLAGTFGSADGTGSAARFYDPEGVAVDASGTVYVAEWGNSTIRKGVPVTSMAPSISNQPTSQAATTGTNVSFTATATGTPSPVYQWQVSTDGGNTWAGLTDTAPYTGTATGALTITGATAAMNGYQYRCVASNGVSPDATSDAATLTVNKATATVNLGGLSATYDGSAHGATASTTPNGLIVTFTYDGGTPAPTHAGSYAVVGTISDATYQGSVSGTLVIAKAVLTAKADDKKRGQGAANPPLTITYTGFVNSETAAVLDSPPTGSTTATGGSPAGTYPITLTGGSDNNYAFTLRNGTLSVTSAGKPWAVTATGSFQSGGRAGLLWFNSTTNETAIWLMNGLTAGGTASYAPGGDWSVVDTGDFDGDGKTDLLWRNSATGGAVIWFMNGTSIASSKWIYDSGTTWVPYQLADFNGDGKTDILWHNTVTGDYAIWLMNGSGELLGASGFAVAPGWEIAQVADFDGDGKDDILWRNSSTGGVVVWFMNGTNIASSKWIYDSGLSWTPAYVADFNGDGKADILWQNTDGSKAIWLMNGSGELLGASGFSVAAGWEVALVADFDGDHKADILWRNSTTGGVVLWTMNGTGASSSAWAYNSGLTWTPVRAADFNGDGKADILWQNIDGSLAIWLMNGATCLSGAGVY